MQFPDFLGYVKRMEKVEAGFGPRVQGWELEGERVFTKHQILFVCLVVWLFAYLLALFLAKVDLYRVDVTLFFSFVVSFVLDKIGFGLGGSGFYMIEAQQTCPLFHSATCSWQRHCNRP